MKPQTLIGRKPEIEVLNKALHSGESEMVALIGRRRVGKTFLVRQALFGRIDFELTGEQNTGMRQQLQNFADRMTFTPDRLYKFNDQVTGTKHSE